MGIFERDYFSDPERNRKTEESHEDLPLPTIPESTWQLLIAESTVYSNTIDALLDEVALKRTVDDLDNLRPESLRAYERVELIRRLYLAHLEHHKLTNPKEG